jgi:hypothetical protein
MTRLQEDYKRAFSSYAAKQEAIGATVSLSVQQIYPITKTLARIVAVASQGEWHGGDYFEAIANLYGNKVIALPNSISDVSDRNRKMISAFVVPNTQAKPYNDDNLKNMKLVTANVFSEDSDKIWEVRGEGDDRVLVQIAGDNIEELLKTRQERYQIATAAMHALDDFGNFRNGDYLLYMSTSEVLRGGFGWHLANGNDKSPYVYDRRDKQLVRISPYQVVEIASGLDEEYSVKFDKPQEETAALSSEAVRHYLDYMGRLFKGTAYFTKLEQLMRDKISMEDPNDITSAPSMTRRG